MAALAGLQPQIAILEKRISNDAIDFNTEKKKNKDRHQIHHERISAMDNCMKETSSSLQKNTGITSKLTGDVEDLERKYSSAIAGAKMQFNDELASERIETAKKIHALQNRYSTEMDNMLDKITESEKEILSKLRNQSEDNSDKLENVRKNVLEEVERKNTKLVEKMTEESKTFKSKIKSHFLCLDTAIDKLQQKELALIEKGAAMIFSLSLFLFFYIYVYVSRFIISALFPCVLLFA